MTILDSVSGIITLILIVIIISYYILLIIPKKKLKIQTRFKSITIIIPAHNEAEYIAECIKAAKEADFRGKKQIIVVDDGSIDKTARIVSKIKGVTFIKTKHSGKSDSINRALKIAEGELIAIVDGDSFISKNSLVEVSNEVAQKNIAAATCIVKVKNRYKLLCIYPHIELLYNSLIRSLFSKVNANITTPGPLSIYRKKELMEIGGFSTEGFSEDVDVTIRLIRKGYRIGFSENTVAYTNMPYDIKGFLRQRTRFARGLINVLKRHMRATHNVIDFYTLPLFLFMYIQSVIMGVLTVYNIISGYNQYFWSQGVVFSYDVAIFIFNWFTLIGFVKWSYSVFTSAGPVGFVTIVGIASTMISFPLFFYSIFKYEKKLDLLHILPIMVMSPYWIIMMFINIICIPEMFARSQYNIWKKNE